MTTSKEKPMLALDVPGKLRAKGYVPVSEAAAAVGLSGPAIHKWVADGAVEGVTHGHRTWVKWIQVILHLGVKKCVVLGIIKEADAAKYETKKVATK